jgi:3-oxoadipate enol-lactonase
MAHERHAVVAGRRMRWLEAGETSDARTLIWLHAFPLCADMWRPQLDAAPAGWRVIAPDLAGLGGTSDREGRAVIADYADDVFALADQLGVRRFVLGGLSMGGYAAFACLRLDASRVHGIVLADTKSGADSPQAREGRQKMLDLVAANGVAGVADEMLPKLLGATTRRDHPGLVAHVRQIIETNGAPGVARAIERLRDRPDSTPLLARVVVPALVVVGEEDGITPVSDARAMADALPDATLAILPGAGHLANLEAPDAFRAALAPWLAGL